MELDLANELWIELRRFISTGDRQDAVDSLVNLLVEQGYDAEDLRTAFKGDSEVKRAITEYFGDDGSDDEDEEEEEYEDFDQDY